MNSMLKDATRSASWKVEVLGRRGGELELYQTRAGWVWYWNNKPADLVALVGVLDDQAPLRKPYSFHEYDGALHHLMYCIGVAFAGRCGLTAAA